MKETDVTLQQPSWRRSRSNILSLISFWWVIEFIKIGNKRPLQESDIDELPINYKSNYLLKKFKSIWMDALNKSKETNNVKDPSLLKVAFNFINLQKYVLLTFLSALSNLGLVSSIIFIRLILQYLDGEEYITTTEAYYYAICLTVTVFSIKCIIHVTTYQLTIEITNLRTSLLAMIHEKSLKISKNAYNTSGIIMLMTEDIQKFEAF
eukprot:126211_1